MTIAGFLLDFTLLVVFVAALAVAAVEVRRLLVPGLRGATSRLAEAVVGVALLVVLSQLLGSVGLFERWPLVVASVAGASAASWARRVRHATAGAPDEEHPPASRLAAAVAVAATAFGLTRCVQAALDALHGGMRSFDTLWYHMPFAARFAQDGWLTHLHYVGNGPTTFYPADGELVHAVGIVFLRSDVLSPVVNVGWLGLLLLAAWCAGRPAGVAPAATVAALVVAFLPVLGGAQAGTAGTDVATLALLVASAALLTRRRAALGTAAVAALAAGVAVGTKLDAWAPAAALAVVAIARARGRRLATSAIWVAGVSAPSAFWYIRNAAVVGNPFPWFGRWLVGIELPATTVPSDCGSTTVAHYLAEPHFVWAGLLPQLPGAWGARWWLVVGVAVAGAVSGLVVADVRARTLAAVACVSGLAYLVTPATAGGRDAACFSFNTRFATPALAFGLLAVTLVLARQRRGGDAAAVVFAAVLVLTTHASSEAIPVVVAVLVVAASVVAPLAARAGRAAAATGLAAAVMVTAVALRHEESGYRAARYVGASFSDPIASIVPVLRRVRNARIAVAGLSEHYPFYGDDLSNRVDYPARRDGARFFTFTTCAAWNRALQRGRYDYVVTAREGGGDAPTARWTRLAPGAHVIAASPPAAMHRGHRWTWQVFHLDAVKTSAQTGCTVRSPAVRRR